LSAARDAATTAVADPGDAAVAAGEAAGEALAAGLERAGAELAEPEVAGAVGAGAVPLQPASSATSANPAAVASADAGRDRFTFLC
jgi:hypothetical protein